MHNKVTKVKVGVERQKYKELFKRMQMPSAWTRRGECFYRKAGAGKFYFKSSDPLSRSCSSFEKVQIMTKFNSNFSKLDSVTLF